MKIIRTPSFFLAAIKRLWIERSHGSSKLEA